MKVALLGFGVVGKGVFEILSERKDMRVAYVLSRRPLSLGSEVRVTDRMDEILSDPSVDLVIEVIGGLHPALEYVSDALKAKKSVVTANKQLISAAYRDLVDLAKKNGVFLRYSAAVGGGVPWLISLERAHRISRIYEFWGILNGTTNFILDAMQEEGKDYASALSEAQGLGYAEADPTADVDGWDAMRKTCISANVAFGVVLPEEVIPFFGIRSITPADVKAARENGYVIKLLGHGRRVGQDGEEIAAWVEPALIPASSREGTVHGSDNEITFDARFVGRERFFGPGAGRYPTGYAVAHDCLDILSERAGVYNWEMKQARFSPEKVVQRYYLRTAIPGDRLSDLIEKRFSEGFVTKPVSVDQMHRRAAQLSAEDPTLFFASFFEPYGKEI